MGVKEQHRDPIKEHRDQIIHGNKSSTIGLDKGCLSCTGNPNYYNEFFKMACLNYTSSPVKFNNFTYSRIELLDKIQEDLE